MFPLCKGERVIIGGYSPQIHSLPFSFLGTGKVIGINQWAAELPCDYWIGLDTGLNWEKFYCEDTYRHLPKFLKTLSVPRFMRKPNKDSESFVPADAGIFFEKAHHPEIPTKWNGTLQFCNTTATAAINLAIILGAKEIVLYGVDFVGTSRADGSQYSRPDFWSEHKDQINGLLQRFQRHVPVYKTHPDSWLECPYMEVL